MISFFHEDAQNESNENETSWVNECCTSLSSVSLHTQRETQAYLVVNYKLTNEAEAEWVNCITKNAYEISWLNWGDILVRVGKFKAKICPILWTCGSHSGAIISRRLILTIILLRFPSLRMNIHFLSQWTSRPLITADDDDVDDDDNDDDDDTLSALTSPNISSSLGSRQNENH